LRLEEHFGPQKDLGLQDVLGRRKLDRGLLYNGGRLG
jgi:hypothetical protein